MQNQNTDQEQAYQHWSKSPYYRGQTVFMKDRPVENSTGGNRFYKSDKEKAELFALELAWKDAQKLKFGENYKQRVRQSVTTTRV